MFGIKSNDKVLFVWGQGIDTEILKGTITQIKEILSDGGEIAVENEEMLKQSNHPMSHFNIALYNIIPPYTNLDNLASLGEILRIIKPSSKLIVRTTVSSSITQLKLAGYVNIVEQNKEKDVIEIVGLKPDFEVGSSVKLSLKASNGSVANGVQTKWKIDLTDSDVTLEDPDDLLNEEDLQRPDPTSLKVCGTTGKRKACKSCVCGLKEELENEEESKIIANKKDFKSSCGSCYLGDAFRCASCPYLGMPAFKPGEKVKLTDSTLQD